MLVASRSRPIRGVAGVGRSSREGSAFAWRTGERRAAARNRARSRPARPRASASLSTVYPWGRRQLFLGEVERVAVASE